MTKLLPLMAGLGLAFTMSFNVAHSAPLTAQQQKMTTCNYDAGDKKGNDRKAFMKECLSAKKITPQERMKTCNRDAGPRKGDERKAFMKSCLTTS